MQPLTYLKAAAAGLMLAGAASLGAQAAPVANYDSAVVDGGVFQFAQMKRGGGGDEEFIRRRGGGDRAVRQRMGERNFDRDIDRRRFDGRRFDGRRFDGRRFDDRRWAWDRGRHGQRFRYRRPGYAYYRDGYWYGSPWWLGAAAGALVGSAIVGGAAASSDAHIEYCLSRYRTYDPQTDTYIGRGGRRYRCVGP